MLFYREKTARHCLSNLGIDLDILEKEQQFPENLIDESKLEKGKSVFEIINSFSKFVNKRQGRRFYRSKNGKA